jgi:hypothetical protein
MLVWGGIIPHFRPKSLIPNPSLESQTYLSPVWDPSQQAVCYRYETVQTNLVLFNSTYMDTIRADSCTPCRPISHNDKHKHPARSHMHAAGDVGRWEEMLGWVSGGLCFKIGTGLSNVHAFVSLLRKWGGEEVICYSHTCTEAHKSTHTLTDTRPAPCTHTKHSHTCIP